MRLARWRPGLPRNGLPHCLLARWLTIALAVAVIVWSVQASRAQDWTDSTIGKQGSEQGVAARYGQASDLSAVAGSQVPYPLRRLPPTGNESSPPAGRPVVAANRFASYEAPVPPPPDLLPESPLDRAVRELQPAEPSQESPLDRAIRELGILAEGATAPPVPSTSGLVLPRPATGGGAQLKLIDISLDGLFAAGTFTADEQELQQLEGGGHDPRKRGFTVRGVELSMQGAVDPYFDGEMHLVNFTDPTQGDTVVELEEAFMTTRSLPNGLQLKAGQFLTEFGRINPTHPHAWAWLDQPVIESRVFGPDGMRAPGARLSWLVPVDWFSQFYISMQNANGEGMASFLANQAFFEERPVGGRPFVFRDVHSIGDLTYSVRWENSWTTCCDEITWLFGMSGAFGPNCTGFNGNTQVYGLDLTRKWKPEKNERGWPFTIWQSEIIMRRYWADSYLGPNPSNPGSVLALPSEMLTDCGFYTQYLYGFKPKWAIGARYEFVWGTNYSLNNEFMPISNNDDPFRDERHRFSPLLAWYCTEFSRFDFQYNFDYAQHLPTKNAHSFWLGAEFMLGSHPAHKF